jgi:UDP-N-acetylmuramoyl-L-alanyl-D-glutamate--2,6-diaminopimelate ligase
MRLSEILPPDIPHPPGAASIEVTGITSSSGAVMPGALFAALPGAKTDGARFIPDAIARGARVIVAGAGKATPVAPPTVLIEVENPRRALALIAAKFSRSQPACAVAVTGTSGKTSVAEFTRQIFASLGHKAASLGTIGVVKPDGAVYGSLTTPDPVTLHATLADLAAEGITHVAFEASSHGLDQHRLDGVKLTAAAFTNLGRDHMDYHPTVDDYLAAKLRLFTVLLQPGQTAVINSDGAYADHVADVARKRRLRVMKVGRGGDALRLEAVERDGFRQLLKVDVGSATYTVTLPLVGAYQVENALVAAGLAIAAGEHAGETLLALAKLKGVPGRLEIIGNVGFLDRDKGKRPIMGRIAVEKADIVIVTDDNPRTEQAASIRSEILAGAGGAREIGDRAEAIGAAVGMMGAGDVVLVAGKGHETGQIIGDRVLPFSDHDEISRAMQSLQKT